jgi:hypothetical protein
VLVRVRARVGACVQIRTSWCVCANSRILIVVARRELLVKVLSRLDLAQVVAGEILKSQ